MEAQQMTLNFAEPAKVRRVVSERTRDSEGRYAASEGEDGDVGDIVTRLLRQNDVLRTNYIIVGRQLAEKERELLQLKNITK